VPRVRPVADYRLNEEVLQPRPTFAAAPGGALSVPYVRWHPPPPGMYDDRPPEYDADEADEAWLAKANAAAAGADDGRGDEEEEDEEQQQQRQPPKRGGGGRGASGAAGKRAAAGGGGGAAGSGGLMAAARGLYRSFSNRFRSSGGGGSSDAADQEQPGEPGAGGAGSGRLGLGEFERAVEKLELLHFAAVSKWWSDMNDGAARGTGVRRAAREGDRARAECLSHATGQRLSQRCDGALC
jgi:hypothetical protein